MDGQDREVAPHDEGLAARGKAEEQFFLVVARRLKHRMADLPHEERRETDAHGGNGILEHEAVAGDEGRGTQEVAHPIYEMAVGSHVVVMFPAHDLPAEG